MQRRDGLEMDLEKGCSEQDFDRVEGVAEDSGDEAPEVVPGPARAPAEKHAVDAGPGEACPAENILDASVQQVQANADLWLAPETVHTPCKKSGPQGLQLDTPEKPAEEMKRKRGRPRKVQGTEKQPRAPTSAMEGKLHPTLGRFFKSDPSAEDMKIVEVQAINSRHIPKSMPNAAEVAETQMVRAEAVER